MGHVTLATPTFKKFVWAHIWTVPGNVHIKFGVCSFNRFGDIAM